MVASLSLPKHISLTVSHLLLLASLLHPVLSYPPSSMGKHFPFYPPTISPAPSPIPLTLTATSTAASPPLLSQHTVVVLAAITCALVCALGLNSTLHCVLRCTRRAISDPAGWAAARRINVGLRRPDILSLPITVYAAGSPGGGGMSPPMAAAVGCPICLSDFTEGEKIRILPVCDHRFHVACIDTWLLLHGTCPTCRHRLSSSKLTPPDIV